MLTAYIRAAMHQACYEIIEDDGSFYGSIPAVPGVWANAQTLEACRIHPKTREKIESTLLLSAAMEGKVKERQGKKLTPPTRHVNLRRFGELISSAPGYCS